MTAKQAKKNIGKRVEWEYAHDWATGTCLFRSGILERVEGRNIVVDGEYYWLPTLRNFKVQK